MAEVNKLSELNEQLIKKLDSMDVKAYMIEDDVKNLVQSMRSIHALILCAENQKKESGMNSRKVKVWLKKLKDIFDDVDHLLDEFSTEELRRKNKKDKKVLIFFSSSNQFLFSSKMATKIKEITKRIKDLKKFSNFNSHPCEQRDLSERETHSFILEENFIGREKEKKDLIKLLLDTNAKEKDNVSVILIIGDEGIGKTALAQLVYNNKEIQRHFELTKWVWVSEIFDITSICEKFLESEDTNNNFNRLSKNVRKEVDGKRYLLVLDDVLNENSLYWSNLMGILKFGAKGSKIILTTRSKKMKILTNPNPFITLDKLNEAHSWRMFCVFAFGDEKKVENGNLVSIGKEIVKKCNGIPLAIYNIGRLMYFKTKENDWLKMKNKNFVLPEIYEDMCTFEL